MPGKEQFLPENCANKYLSVSLLGRLCEFYGERGNLLAGIHRFLRYVDNQVDENSKEEPINEKLSFLEKQISVNNKTNKNDLLDEEKRYDSLPWESVGELETKVRSNVNVVLHTIKEDLIHQPYIPRTSREIRQNNIRMFYSSLNIVGLVLNGKDIKPTQKFVNFLDIWNDSGSLKDMKEDLKNGMLQIPFSKNEVEEILKEKSADDRLNLSLKIYDKDRFKKEKSKAINGIIKYSGSLLDLDMPLWQKLTAYFYILTRVTLKTTFQINYPSFEPQKIEDVKEIN